MTRTYEKSITIKSWAEEDRPREKLMRLGRRSMTDAELIAILIGSGTRSESAVSLSQRILENVNNNLNELGKMSLSKLQEFKGIGAAKAIAIIAATELGRRRQLAEAEVKPLINNSSDAFKAIAPQLLDLPHEEFWILLLNRANRVIGTKHISSGGLSATVVDTRLIFHSALHVLASSIILCHNHPSGNLSPSQSDIDLTKKLQAAGKSIDVPVLDHIIVAGNSFYSLLDEGRMVR